MKQLWIGLVEVLTEPRAMAGDTRAFTNVVTWAQTALEYVASVTTVFDEYGWTMLATENVRRIDSSEAFNEEIAEIIERAKSNPKACIFATFYSYPSRPS